MLIVLIFAKHYIQQMHVAEVEWEEGTRKEMLG